MTASDPTSIAGKTFPLRARFGHVVVGAGTAGIAASATTGVAVSAAGVYTENNILMDVKAGVRDAAQLAAEEASRAGAAVEGPLLHVVGDERLLRRALRNLLENARRYGGDEILVTLAPGGRGGAELRVCDRGPGVPDAWRERIFEPFLRLPGHAEREGGVGLGLALVRQIARRHGGEAACLPRAGGGSCFLLTLPGSAVAPSERATVSG